MFSNFTLWVMSTYILTVNQLKKEYDIEGGSSVPFAKPHDGSHYWDIVSNPLHFL